MGASIKTVVVGISILALSACGDNGGQSSGASSKKTATVDSADFIKACENYYNNASTAREVGRYNPTPDVQAFGVSKYCACIDGNIDGGSAKQMKKLEGLTGEDIESASNGAASSRLAQKTREMGVEFYAEMAAWEKDRDNIMRPGSYKLMGHADSCNAAIRRE